MSEVTQLSNRLPTDVRIGRKGYQAGHDVKARASVSREAETTDNHRAMSRLNRFLSQGQPLREDVPRGFHLNIVI